jgi:uncharacterized protein (TIGR02246 family)
MAVRTTNDSLNNRIIRKTINGASNHVYPTYLLAARLQRVATMTDDERAIREVVDTWMAASTAGDTATVLSLMADDVVFLTPGKEPFGKREFAASASAQAAFRIDGKADVREVRASGDWGFTWAHLDITMTPTDGSPAVRKSGYTLTVFQKLPNDRWVLARDANLLTDRD